MTTLKARFTKSGFELEQVERIGNVAIYRRWKTGQSPHYEVVRIRSREAREVFGKEFEAGEYYPSSEEWGTYGWTYPCLDDARRRVGVLTGAKLKNGVTPEVLT